MTRTPRPAPRLGEATVRSLLGGMPVRDPASGQAAALLSRLIREEADVLDGIAEQLHQQAEYAIDQLSRVADGRDQYRHRSTDGVLQLTGPQIDMLLARRGDAVRHLTGLCTALKALSQATAAPAPVVSCAPGRRLNGR
ncbi:hypothetical protein ACFC8F_34165 [Streptomyces hydrogenans]|uniref:hypothetical protein n=1 Tax=Streptomyces hydrogenans TaxID=1873719 RepID=UPI0035DFEEE9